MGLQVQLSNSILWGGAAPSGDEIAVLPANPIGDARLTVRSCDVQGGAAGVSVGAGSSLLWGPGNLALDPLFADADGPDGNPLTPADNDWRLGLGSPCADAGANPLLPQDVLDADASGHVAEFLPVDLDGAARQQDDPAAPDTGIGAAPLVDMGAFERP